MTDDMLEYALTVLWKNRTSISDWAHVRAHINGALILCNHSGEQRESLRFLYDIASRHASQ